MSQSCLQQQLFELVKRVRRLLQIPVLPFPVALCGITGNRAGRGHILKHHSCLSELTLFAAEEKISYQGKEWPCLKKEKLRILENRRPLETNHVKFVKESITEFKIMINCMLEVFLYPSHVYRVLIALVESVSEWLSLDLGLN